MTTIWHCGGTNRSRRRRGSLTAGDKGARVTLAVVADGHVALPCEASRSPGPAFSRRAAWSPRQARTGDGRQFCEHVSLAVVALVQTGEPSRERTAKAVIAKASTYEEDGEVRIPGVTRCIAGTM